MFVQWAIFTPIVGGTAWWCASRFYRDSVQRKRNADCLWNAPYRLTAKEEDYWAQRFNQMQAEIDHPALWMGKRLWSWVTRTKVEETRNTDPYILRQQIPYALVDANGEKVIEYTPD